MTDPLETLKIIRRETWIVNVNNGWGNLALEGLANKIYNLCIEVVGKEPNDKTK